jgi:hypothetical protein
LVQIVRAVILAAQVRARLVAAAGRGEAIANVVEGVFKLLPGHDASIGPIDFLKSKLSLLEAQPDGLIRFKKSFIAELETGAAITLQRLTL